MDKIKIIKATLEDLKLLQTIGTQTFLETFAEHNSAEDMQNYLDESFHEDKLREELSNTNSEFYFASLEDNIIGYLKINHGKAQTENIDKKSLEIERIYVLKNFHGKQVGQILYDKAIEIARQTKMEYVWLGVWEKNPRAISFYKKNGFIEFDKHIFRLGNDEQTDIMMHLKINE